MTTSSRWHRLTREAKIGVVAVGSVIATRVLLGNFVVNDWEGWGTFLGVAVATVIEGLVLGGLVFGLAVRIAARSRGTRPAITALVVGTLAIFSLAIPYSAPKWSWERRPLPWAWLPSTVERINLVPGGLASSASRWGR